MKGSVEKEGKHMIIKDVELCTSSYLIRRIQIGTPVIGHFLPLWLTETKLYNKKKDGKNEDHGFLIILT